MITLTAQQYILHQSSFNSADQSNPSTPVRLHNTQHQHYYFSWDCRDFANLRSNHSSRYNWSSIVARRTYVSRCNRSGLGGAIFWSPSLHL